MIEIGEEDIRIIMQEDYHHWDKLTSNCFCWHCKGEERLTTIVNYKAYLNDLEDILLKGECKTCGHPVNRYIETGENKEKAAVAKHIRLIMKQYRTVGRNRS